MADAQHVITCPKCGYADWAAAPHECQPEPARGRYSTESLDMLAEKESAAKRYDVEVNVSREVMRTLRDLSLADLAVLPRDVGWDVRSLPADWAADEDMLVVAKESA
jgi:hypothetical protein